MPEHIVKVSASAASSPVARAGAGDLTPRALGRERRALFETPPARMQPVHPKKLFSVPVSKFTCRRAPSSPQLARIRSCLDEYRRAAAPCDPPGPLVVPGPRPKAASMEDLTPKKANNERSTGCIQLAVSRSGGARSEDQAAARIGRFMLVAAWRRRRQEVLALRTTIDTKRICTERLRVQVWTLKSLLDGDNTKLVKAMRELQRLRLLLRDRDEEKAVLEREKLALEKDVSAAEDRASELSIGWRNSRNELEAARDALQRCARERDAERAAARDARAQRDRAYTRINLLEEELAQHQALLAAADGQAAALRRHADEQQRAQLRRDHETQSRHAAECAALTARAALAAQEASVLRATVEQLRGHVMRLETELAAAREQLAWWPRPLTRMMGVARAWLRRPMSLPEAVMWSLIPARHGCY